jgi:hypothetical protein
MRSIAFVALLVFSPALARAQEGGSALDPESYVALSADDRAQLSIGGFRSYLERIRSGDELLYRELDPHLDDLESRELAADVIFGVGTGLSIAALVSVIPVYTELSAQDSEPIMIGLISAGLGTFVISIIIQAIVRPGQGDLVRLIDQHDELVGRR